MTESLESQAYKKAFDKVKAMSNETLQGVWQAATGQYAHPEDGYGSHIGNSWVVLTWDEWCEILYSELSARGLSVLV
jgi:hypothetical protein